MKKPMTTVILVLLAIILIGIVIVGNRDTSPSAEPMPTKTRPRTTAMYACGYDRCKDSGEYGNLVFDTIVFWSGPDPDRGGRCGTASHGDSVLVIREKRVSPGPGGLWYELENGCWINDLWLTKSRCATSNLHEYGFRDCLAGQY